MITSVDAESFFGDNRPSVIPSDAPSPEWELLVNRTQSLDPSLYPNFILKSILEYEHKGIINAIDTLTKHLSPGMYAQRYIDMIRSAWQPDRQWTDAFAAHLTEMFSGTGLVLLDPRWKGIKELFKNVFFAELTDPLASTALVNREADKLTSRLKSKKVLRKHEGSTNLFIEMEGVRHPLNFSNNEFTASEHPFSKSELFDLIDSDPERFSPAAALRPVCQDTILPVAALISGPGERAYLRQVKPLYDMFKVNGSLLWPRASFTVIDQRTIRTATKEKIALSKLFENLDSIHTKLTWNTFPEDVKHELDSIDQTIRSGFDSLAERIGSIDSTLVKSVEKGKGKALHIIKEISERAMRSHKAKTAVSETRLASASYFLRPQNGPQERWFGADSILPLLEDEEFKKFITLTSPNEEYHRIIIME